MHGSEMCRDVCVNRFRSTFVDRNAPSVLIHAHLIRAKISLSLDACRSKCVSEMFKPMFVQCSYLLSLDARRSKCVSHVLRCALARRLSIQTRFSSAQMRSRSTLVNPNAFPVWSDVLSLDACRSKCVSHVIRCAFARRPSIQTRFSSAQMRSRSTPADLNAFPKRSADLAQGCQKLAEPDLADKMRVDTYK